MNYITINEEKEEGRRTTQNNETSYSQVLGGTKGKGSRDGNMIDEMEEILFFFF